MTGDVIRLDTDELRSLVSELKDGVAAQTASIANAVGRLNHGVDAFGVIFGEVLGAPSRLAMLATSRHLDGLARDLEDFAQRVGHAADGYDEALQDSLAVARSWAG